MFEEAVNYPRESEEAWKTVAIGSVLTLVSFLIIPGVLVVGFYQRVLRATLTDESVPVFDDWGDLFVEGLKAAVVVIIYSIVPALVVGVSAASIAGAVLSDGIVSGALTLGAIFGVLLGVLLWLVLWYVVPAGLANLARTERIGSAFAFGELRPALFSREYATAWLLALGVLIIAGVIAGAVSAVPLGFVVAIPVQFYATVVAFHLYGRGVADAGEVAETTDRAAGQAAV